MADQVYVTHCQQSDSVKGQGGFSIRAASTHDPELLRFALDYPAYELPLDMWSEDPTPAQAPRRLALVPGPRQTMALIHSAYLGKDTLGRPGNYFTHILFYPTLPPVQALESWGAPEWRTSYPTGETQTLPKAPEAAPRGPFLRERIVTAFLTGKWAGAEPKLIASVCPPRLQRDPARAHELVHKTLQALFLAREEGQNPRGRLYLAGEPGLVALLLYSAVRLLPAGTTDHLTFSTYENMHRTLRQYKLAWAVGAFTPNPEKRLEQEYIKTRGYGLDLGDPSYGSAEIADQAPPMFAELLTLATEGKWETLHHLHQCHGPGRVTEESLDRARTMLERFARAQSGKLSAEELVDLGRTSSGADLIQKNPDLFWPLVYQFGLTDDAVRQAFGGMIKERFPELIGQAGKLLAAGDLRWKSPWGLVKGVEKSQDRLAALWLSLLTTAAKVAPAKPYLGAMRQPVLQEWHRLCPPHQPVPDPVKEFLSLTSVEEFAALQNAALPAPWSALALGEALARKEPWAAEAFDQAKDAVVQAFCAGFDGKADGQQSAAKRSALNLLTTLQALIPNGEKLPRLFRLLKNGLTLPPDLATALLDGLEEGRPSLPPAWLQDDNLSVFLGQLGPPREKAGPCWQRFCRFLNKDLLYGGKGQRALFQCLLAARAQNEGNVPAEAALALEDWSYLAKVFTAPSGEFVVKEIEAVCTRRGLPPGNDLLKDYFEKVVRALPVEDPRVEAFAQTFHRLFPPGSDYQPHLKHFDQWAGFLKDTNDPGVVLAFLLFFLEKHIPADYRQDVAKERKKLLGESGIQLAKKLIVEKKPRTPAPGLSARAAPKANGSLPDLVRGLTFPQRTTLLVGLIGTHLLIGMAGCWMAKPVPPMVDSGSAPARDPHHLLLNDKNHKQVDNDLAEMIKTMAASPLKPPLEKESLAAKLKTLNDEMTKKTGDDKAKAVNKAVVDLAVDLAAYSKKMSQAFKEFHEKEGEKNRKRDQELIDVKKLEEQIKMLDEPLFELLENAFESLELDDDELATLKMAKSRFFKLDNRALKRLEINQFLAAPAWRGGLEFLQQIRLRAKASELMKSLE